MQFFGGNLDLLLYHPGVVLSMLVTDGLSPHTPSDEVEKLEDRLLSGQYLFCLIFPPGPFQLKTHTMKREGELLQKVAYGTPLENCWSWGPY